MIRKVPAILATGAAIVALSALPARSADTKAPSFEDVSNIFRSRCNSCHNTDKAKGGLVLESYTGTMQGGGSGKVVEPGDLDGSHLWNLVSHKEEPKMPPNSPKIPDAELNVIKAWIEAGAPETAGAKVAMKPKPKFEFKLDPNSLGKPVGPPAMPEKVSSDPVVVSPKPNAILAMASSPWAPLVAIAGHKQVLLYHSDQNRLVAVFPFPEGTIHCLKFSRNGSLLLAGGGRGGQNGLAVVYDVKTGKRVFEIGKEYDSVLAADISPDHGQVALGGPGRIVRVYSTADGQLQFEMKKHTDWITALEFSPDGVLLASGDRSNGLFVWEGQTGREFFELRGHNGPVTDVSWRLDSNVLASASEDTTVKLWEMENGGQIKSWGAHGGGVASVRFAKDGRLTTTGRDKAAKLWDQNGGQQRVFEGFADLALRSVFSHDEQSVIAGDWTGEVRVFDAKDGKRLANLVANPLRVADRLEANRKAIPAAKAAVDQATKELQALTADAAAKAGVAAKVQQDLAAAQQAANQKTAEIAAAEKALAGKAAEETAAAAALAAANKAVADATAVKAAAEKDVPATVAAEKTASDSLAGLKVALEKALADKAAHDQALAGAINAMKAATTKVAADAAAMVVSQQTLRAVELTAALATIAHRQAQAQMALEGAVAARVQAPKTLEAATATLAAKTAAVAPAQALVTKLAAEKAAIAKTVADAKAALPPLTAAVTAKTGELTNANNVKAAADKAAADKKAAADLLAKKLQALQIDIDALAAEKQAADAGKSAMNASPNRPS